MPDVSGMTAAELAEIVRNPGDYQAALVSAAREEMIQRLEKGNPGPEYREADEEVNETDPPEEWGREEAAAAPEEAEEDPFNEKPLPEPENQNLAKAENEITALGYALTFWNLLSMAGIFLTLRSVWSYDKSFRATYVLSIALVLLLAVGVSAFWQGRKWGYYVAHFFFCHITVTAVMEVLTLIQVKANFPDAEVPTLFYVRMLVDVIIGVLGTIRMNRALMVKAFEVEPAGRIISGVVGMGVILLIYLSAYSSFLSERF